MGMEIHIDTTKDSKDDVKKLIDFLSRWVAEQEAATSLSMPGDNPSPFEAAALPGFGFLDAPFSQPAVDAPAPIREPPRFGYLEPILQPAAGAMASAAPSASLEPPPFGIAPDLNVDLGLARPAKPAEPRQRFRVEPY